jgi:hypothetical protein
VSRSSLGRVLDTKALDQGVGPRARLRVNVPAAWLAEGAELVIAAPERLLCAHCDGGGCDACQRSGALRAPAEASHRIVRASFGAQGTSRTSVTLRIAKPFGDEHDIDQLLLAVHAADAPSACVTREETPGESAPHLAYPELAWRIVSIAVAIAAAVLMVLLGR